MLHVIVEWHEGGVTKRRNFWCTSCTGKTKDFVCKAVQVSASMVPIQTHILRVI